LYYYRARYYHPGLQRFISEDPIGFVGGVNFYTYVDNRPLDFVDPEGRFGLSAAKAALKKVHGYLGGSLPKGKPGRITGSPQRGTPRTGYRLDPPHPNRPAGHPESYPHINWWDGKRKSGGRKGVEPIIGGVLGVLGEMLDPFDAVSGELAGPEDDMLPGSCPQNP
jgi:hypothetical protein